MVYINSEIKKGTFNDDGNITNFADFVVAHMSIVVDSVKREETKKRKAELYTPVFKDLPDMVAVDKMHSLLYRMKIVILKSLNSRPLHLSALHLQEYS